MFRWFLRRRLRAGKELEERLNERFGNPVVPRPDGPLAWFHAASVGESLSLLPLLDRLNAQRPDVTLLLTTGTITSAELMARRLPPGVVHQFVPVDAAGPVRRFLAHWKPDLAVWTESDLWPRMVCDTARSGARMVLVNGRISARSARRLRWAGRYAAALFDRFDALLLQDAAVAAVFQGLGARPEKVQVTGNLKDTADPLPHDPETLKQMTKNLSGRTVWLAASTHPGEELPIATAHRAARRRFPGLILILVPRHPNRGPDIARMLRNDGWSVGCRSQGDSLDRNTEIYLADTMGELGLWYRLAAVSFLGGSLVESGGHNPFEPALLGSAILHGPHVTNFETTYARFEAANAARVVPSAELLPDVLIDLLPADKTAEMATAAWAVSSEGADVARRVVDVLAGYLPAPRG